MKVKFLFFCFSFWIVSYSFSQEVLFLNPLFTGESAILAPAAEGKWIFPDINMTISIQKAGDNFYLLSYGSEKNPSTFEAVFVRINNEYFMDMSGAFPDSIGDKDFRNSFLACHTIYKVGFTRDSLQLLELNDAWFYENAVKKKLPLNYISTDNGVLLTMKTEELISFFTEHKNTNGVFGNSITLIRKRGNAERSKGIQEPVQVNSITGNIPQTCLPIFPHKDGWLGADGDVSVPISKNKTLFIFSDTYVGSKNQTSRAEPGIKMVSNTVAIETCMANGKTDVQYFWGNMYADNPQPIFKSFTNCYHYWVNDAFIHKNSLYVLLQKVAPKKDAVPGDVFNFTLPGITLAKIVNPLDAPVHWKIQLIPWSPIVGPFLGMRCHAIQVNFVYFFVCPNDNSPQFLIIKNLDSIDSPENLFEYYAKDKSWKTGISIDDMDTINNGFRANTVNYHPDIKLWVMVFDIKFLDNKIKIRTSASLTGPWSEEKIVYEIPEVTPGKDSYNKSNFCYLSRECI